MFKDVICMCEKVDEDLAMIGEKPKSGKKEVIVSRKELRRKLIQETIKENREALERLSRI